MLSGVVVLRRLRAITTRSLFYSILLQVLQRSAFFLPLPLPLPLVQVLQRSDFFVMVSFRKPAVW